MELTTTGNESHKTLGGQLYLMVQTPKLNVFNLDSSLLSQNLGFFMNVHGRVDHC
ncbi:MAG: hypothetical protein MZV70_40820 [Desulfobacterales bacterium]|nr:hypothetical protein [Desulfobacterales bacterium]